MIVIIAVGLYGHICVLKKDEKESDYHDALDTYMSDYTPTVSDEYPNLKPGIYQARYFIIASGPSYPDGDAYIDEGFTDIVRLDIELRTL